jgi:hypothetical protein
MNINPLPHRRQETLAPNAQAEHRVYSVHIPAIEAAANAVANSFRYERGAHTLQKWESSAKSSKNHPENVIINVEKQQNAAKGALEAAVTQSTLEELRLAAIRQQVVAARGETEAVPTLPKLDQDHDHALAA